VLLFFAKRNEFVYLAEPVVPAEERERRRRRRSRRKTCRKTIGFINEVF
jgi:hypothetical protein